MCTGCLRIHFCGAQPQGISGMGSGGRHQGMLRSHQPRMVNWKHPDGQIRIETVPKGGIYIPEQAISNRWGHTTRWYHLTYSGKYDAGRDAESPLRLLLYQPIRQPEQPHQKCQQGQFGAVCRWLHCHSGNKGDSRKSKRMDSRLPENKRSGTIGRKNCHHPYWRRIWHVRVDVPKIQGKAYYQTIQEIPEGF